MSGITEQMRKLVLPCIATRNVVAFPGMPLNLKIARAASKRACEAAAKGDGYVFLAAQKDSNIQEPKPEDLHEVGTIAKIERIVKGNGGVVHAILEPLTRAYTEEMVIEKFFLATVVEKSVEIDEVDVHADALVRDVRRVLESFSKSMPKFSKELWLVIDAMDDPGMLCDFIAANIVSDFDRTKHLGARTYHNVITNGGVAFANVLTCTAKGNSLIN